jgi:hypothetical protein
MSGRWLLLLLLLVAPVQAWAAVDDEVSVTQVVAPSAAAVNARDLSQITQSGSSNIAQTLQTDSRDTAAISQSGKGNYSIIQQTGSHDTASINQIGNGLSLTIRQTGSGQSVSITQRR